MFVSYRTADARYPAAYLADRLGKDFGPDRVFRDADALVPGLPWPDGLDRALADARVLVVLIGPGWLDAPGPDGSGRALDRPDDWVRREIRTALTREITVVPVLLDEWDVEVHPDGRRAFVPTGIGRLTVIDTASNAVVTTIPTADDPRDNPVGVAVTPDGSRAYATNRGAGTVAVVDTQRNSLISRIDVDRGPNGAAVAPDGSHLYVTNEGSGTVSIVNLIDGSVMAIPVGSAPITVAVTPDGHRALVVARGSTSLVVLDTATKEILHTVDLGHDPGSISVAPDGRTAYVTAGKANLVLTVTL